MTFVGIDYSLSCPAICVCTGEFHVSNCKFYYFTTDKKRAAIKNDWIEGSFQPSFSCDQERFSAISDWTLSKIPLTTKKIVIEDYAFAAKGRVFHIGENCGYLKINLWKCGLPFEVVPPPTLKKFATGFGNAQKERMIRAFEDETGIDLHKILLTEFTKKSSPTDDVADAYFLCKMGSK